MRPLTNDEAWIVSHNLRLVDACLRRRKYDDATWQDLRSAGYLGLCRAVQSYDPAKSQFSTYATYWIRCFIRREHHKQHLLDVPEHHRSSCPKHDGWREAQQAITAQRVGWDDDNASGVLAVTHPRESTSDQERLARRCLDELRPLHREIVQRIIMHGERIADVASDVNLSRQRVAAIRDYAIRHARLMLSDLNPYYADEGMRSSD